MIVKTHDENYFYLLKVKSYLSVEECADYFGVEKQTITKWVRERKINCLRVTHRSKSNKKTVRFSREQIRKFEKKFNYQINETLKTNREKIINDRSK